MKPINPLIKLGLLCWSTLLLGWQNGWATRKDITDYAVSLLSDGRDNGDENIALIAASSDYSDEELLGLVMKVSDKDVDGRDKWRLANLVYIAESTMNDQEKIDALQEVHAKFDYPEDMTSCSIYSQDNIDPLVAMMQVVDKLKEKFGV